MSYMLTDVSLYGVTLSYEEALRVLEHAGKEGFRNELANEFQFMTEEFGQLDVFDMKSYYDDLECGLSVNYPYKTFNTLIEFFDYFSFCQYQVVPSDREWIPTVFDKQRDIQYHRLRYYVDLFCLDADSRGDSLRCMPGRESVYGVYIASDGYAYRDNLRAFDSDPRIETNFETYCVPVLQKLELNRTPQRIIIQQTW